MLEMTDTDLEKLYKKLQCRKMDAQRNNRNTVTEGKILN